VATAAPAVAIVMTTGVNLRRARATAMMVHGHSDAVLAKIVKARIKTHEAAIKILGGPTASVTVVNAIGGLRTRSRATCTCRVGRSANWFATAIASTRSAALNHEPSRPSERFEWSPVVISGTTTAARLTRARAIFATCVNKGWSRPRACLGTATMPSP
jgi:hypothetical protein